MSGISWLSLAVLIIQLIILGTGLYFKSYLAKKGENLATRQDLSALTRAVEEVKAQFATQHEQHKHRLARQLEEHRLGLATELPLYEALWERVLKMEKALHSLQVAFAIDGGPESRKEARDRFEEERETLRGEMNRVRPFIAPEVYLKLSRAFHIIQKFAKDSQVILQGASPNRHQVISDGITATSAAFQVLSTTIRNRLYPMADQAENNP